MKQSKATPALHSVFH